MIKSSPDTFEERVGIALTTNFVVLNSTVAHLSWPSTFASLPPFKSTLEIIILLVPSALTLRLLLNANLWVPALKDSLVFNVNIFPFNELDSTDFPSIYNEISSIVAVSDSSPRVSSTVLKL